MRPCCQVPGLRAGGMRYAYQRCTAILNYYYAWAVPVSRKLALALLVARVLADHHDSTVTANHLALIADLLDARLDLHGFPLRGCRVELQFPPGSEPEPWLLLVAVDDTAPGEVVRAKFHHNAVSGEDANVVLTHLSRDVCEHNVAVGQLNAEHRVGQGFVDRALNLNDAVFLGHILR